jgi:hypothetical protein
MINKPIQLIENEGEPLKLMCDDPIRSRLTTFGYCYLQDLGYFNEVPCDIEGYTPWYTFPAIHFLKDMLTRDMKVFEYGSGFSTIFYKNHVDEYYTVEHDLEWATRIVNVDPTVKIHVASQHIMVLPNGIDRITDFFNHHTDIQTSDKNHDLQHGLINMDFAGYASQIYHKEKGYYDVVVIDGMARSLCAYLTIEMIKDDFIIILDNIDRCQYNYIQKLLIENGFGRIDFYGPGFQNHHAWCTSFYSRNFKIKNNKIERPVTGEIILI